MKIFLTGGSGDLGILLARQLEQRGEIPVRLDIRQPRNPQRGTVIQGSILDRPLLSHSILGCDIAVHIAAWHGIHEVTGKANVYNFWDLNVTGTFNVFQAAVEAGIKNMVYISSTSAENRFGVYGHTKVLGEEIALTYHQRHGMNVIILRPGAFIPYWNTEAYQSFAGWAQWYWKGAVHIRDVVQAVLKSIDCLKNGPAGTPMPLNVDGKYEYTVDDLSHWDANGPGTTFRRYYAEYEALARQFDLDPALKPTVFDIGPTRQRLGYEPTYSFLDLLKELKEFGADGPPEPEF
jgi:nucleoside-diphosphate-sugar epimerase